MTAAHTAPEPVILVVQSPGNAKVLAEAVTEVGMIPWHVSTAADLSACLSDEGPQPVRAALVDVSGFGQEVWSLCNELHQRNIPFVVMSPSRDQVASTRSLACGAASVLQKPVAREGLLTLLRPMGECNEFS